jgi:hypothetical protein
VNIYCLLLGVTEAGAHWDEAESIVSLLRDVAVAARRIEEERLGGGVCMIEWIQHLDVREIVVRLPIFNHPLCSSKELQSISQYIVIILIWRWASVQSCQTRAHSKKHGEENNRTDHI